MRRVIWTVLLTLSLLWAGCAPQGLSSPNALNNPDTLRQGASAPAGLDVTRRVLDSGLTVLNVERDNLPVVRLTLLIKAGAFNEPPELSGLASLTASLLTEGTASRSSTRISEEVEFIGASLDASANRDFTIISLSVLKKDLDKGFELLSDILLNPVFSPQEIARSKALVTGALRQREEDPGYVASRTFKQQLYGSHPYGRVIQGEPGTIQRISRADIVGFYSDNYRPNNAVLSVAGMINTTELDGLIGKYLSSWTPAVVHTPTVPVPPATSYRLVTLDRDITQANIVMGHMGVSRSDPDYYALQVMNYILGGGGFSSRLMARLRDDMGLTYGIYSSFSAHRDTGDFFISIQTKNDAARAAIDEIRKQIRLIRQDGVRADELADAKAFLTGSFPRRIDTMGKISSFLSMVEFYGLGLDYPAQYARRINSVTLQDIRRVARRHLSADDLILVMVAKLAEASPLPTEPAPEAAAPIPHGETGGR